MIPRVDYHLVPTHFPGTTELPPHASHLSLARLCVSHRGENGVYVRTDELLVLLAAHTGGHTAHQKRSLPGPVRVERRVQVTRHGSAWGVTGHTGSLERSE